MTQKLKNLTQTHSSTDMRDQRHALNIMYLHGGEKVQSRTRRIHVGVFWGAAYDVWNQRMRDERHWPILESRNGIVHPRYIRDI